MADEEEATDQPAGPDTSEVVMYAAGVLLLVASFLPMLEIDIAPSEDDLGFGELFGAFIDTEWSAWSDAFSIFPLVTLPVLCVLVLVGLRALTRFAGTTVPERILGFPVPVVRAAAAGFAGVAVASQLIRALVDSGEEEDGALAVGLGGWLAAVALVALVVTAVQEAMSTPTVDAERRRPDARATGIVVAGAVVVAIASVLDVWSVEGEDGVTAWSEGGRPVYLVPLVMAVMAAVATVVDFRADERRVVLGVDLGRWRVLLAALALFAALALLIGNSAFGSFDSFIDTGVGLYLSILGAGAVVAGTALKPAEATASAAPASDPPAPPPTAPPADPPAS